MKILVTGGVRSGKSTHAEALMPAGPVRYIAPGTVPDPASTDRGDQEWAARVAAHRARRPPQWTTHETRDVAELLADPAPALVDCLGTWLTGTMDDLDVWHRPEAAWRPELDERVTALAAAWAASPATLIAVTNEVGWGLVSEHWSGRVFTDWLGRVNRLIADASDEVHLVVAGRVLRL